LLAHKLLCDVAYFQYTVASHKTSNASGQAWCRGDLGVATGMLGAARGVDESAWECEALAVAFHEAERSFSQTEVLCAGLCHGAAGLGHLFNRFYQATNESRLSEAAQHWFHKALEMRRPGFGIGGDAAWWGNGGEVPDGPHEPGIMIGASGVALALLAACTDIEPVWDRMFLVSVPPKHQRLEVRIQ
jgi:hypothetical protein